MKNSKGNDMAITNVNNSVVQRQEPTQRVEPQEKVQGNRVQKEDVYTSSALSQEVKANLSTTQSTDQMARLEQLSQQIQNGTFKVDSRAIAENLVQDKSLMKMLSD